MNRILAVAVVFGVILVALYIALLPHSKSGFSASHGRTAFENSQIRRDFSGEEFTRAADFHNAIRPWQILRIVLNLFAPLALLFWATRPGNVSFSSPYEVKWWVNGFSWLLLIRATSLPSDFVVRRELMRVGLSHQSWTSWFIDLAKSFLLSTVITLVVIAFLTRWSHVVTAGKVIALSVIAVVVTGIVSFLIPVVLEPMFNSFSSLPPGELRSSLMVLANDAGVPVNDILVVDASRRTPAMNAYVSGIGPSRRVVLYDNLVNDAPAPEVEVIVAHELGHVANNDVVKGTVLSALLAAVGSLVIMALLSTGRFMGFEVVAVASFLAVTSLLVATPFNTFSRRIESRADEFAINRTQATVGVETFTVMQKRMAIRNYSNLQPNSLMYIMFATHPTAVERISFARDMAQFNAWPIPRDLASTNVR